MRDENTLNVKIYDHFYKYLVKKEGVELDDDTKVTVIESILHHEEWQVTNAIRAYVKYNRDFDLAVRNTGIEKKELRKHYNVGARHMYFPSNIAEAIPGFYTNIINNTDLYTDKHGDLRIVGTKQLVCGGDVFSQHLKDYKKDTETSMIDPDDKFIVKMDLDGAQYIVTALRKSGIFTKKQLYKHLSLGYYYLWSIPGCGNVAIQKILKAIDKWENRIATFD